MAYGLLAVKPSWIIEEPSLPLKCTCKIRYRQPDVACTIYPHQNGLEVRFDSKVAAVAPGQSVVFYQNEDCLGGAVIDKALKD